MCALPQATIFQLLSGGQFESLSLLSCVTVEYNDWYQGFCNQDRPHIYNLFEVWLHGFIIDTHVCQLQSNILAYIDYVVVCYAIRCVQSLKKWLKRIISNYSYNKGYSY